MPRQPAKAAPEHVKFEEKSPFNGVSRGIGVLLRRYFTVALSVASLAGIVAVSEPADARGARHAAMMIDANTGAVLHNDDGDELRHPASLTKMMTLYLTFETIESGRLSMSDRVQISDIAASVAPSKLGLEPGEDIAVNDAIKALITKSANDVAVALAEKIGGSQANFVRLMNARARDMGMSKTHFENASGLPDDDQVTTARDMITLGLRLQDDFPSYYPMFATRVFNYRGASHRNHNTMLNNFAGIDGIKTGYIRKSGFNVVTSVHRSGKHIVGAVFGGSSAATRNSEMRMLLTRGLTRASSVKTRKPALALVAKLKLKAEPKLAQRPEKPKPPVQVAQAQPSPAPAPIAVASKKAAAAPTPVAQPVSGPLFAEPDLETTSEAQAQSPAESAPMALPAPEVSAALPPAPVEVFKVKKVIVTPRKVSPDETTDMDPDDSELTIERLVARASQETVISKTSSTPPQASTQGTQVAQAEVPVQAPAIDKSQMTMLGAGDASPASLSAPRPVAEPAPVVTMALAVSAAPARKAAAAKPNFIKAAMTAPAPVPAQRGLKPSSLQAQAASLEPSSAVRQTAVAPTSAGLYEIQIGAYDTVQEAQRNIDAVEAKAGNVLAGHPSVTQPAQKAGQQIYRARFRGFDSQSAANTCSTLRGQSINCFVISTE